MELTGGQTQEKVPLLGKKGLTGSTIKMIAMITMLIDHVGAVIVERAMVTNVGVGLVSYDENLYYLDMVLRMIGRLGFPIFCFLLVEGFMHTRNVWKYAGRLFLFALISEVPFDLAFRGKLWSPDYQNVFFTLFLGLVAMIYCDRIWKQENWPKFSRVCLCIVGMSLCIWAAHLLHTDYAAIGVICILVLYVTRQNRMVQVIAGGIAFAWELTAPLAFLPVAAYNGQRGLQLKYVFYLFYPVHLLILYGIAYLLGIA